MVELKDLILIVEDSDITLYKLKAVLIRIGYEVVAFDNPVQAMDWLATSQKKPDLIISDVSMPGMDGYEFIRKVRSQEEIKKTPIILLTSHVDTRDKMEGIAAGADDYLGKTVSVTELELRVKALLARKNGDDTPISQISARSISVFSLRGGVGVSSIAVNLAVAISHLWGIDTCLWDMAMGIGQCALMMNLKPTSTIASLSEWADSTLDEMTLRNMLVNHETKVNLIPAPSSIEEIELITPKVVDLVWSGATSLAPYLIIDAGGHISEQTLTVLERSDIILLTLAPELASINAAYQTIKLFTDLGFSSGKIQLILNHTSLINPFTIDKISDNLKKNFLAEIPYDGKNMIKAINQGTPYLNIAPKTQTSMEIFKLAYRITANEMRAKKTDRDEEAVESLQKLVFGT